MRAYKILNLELLQRVCFLDLQITAADPEKSMPYTKELAIPCAVKG